MACYLILGWCIVFKFNLLPETVGMNGIYLLVAGGVAYTIGTIFYGLQEKIHYMHCIWHLWILLGSVLHLRVQHGECFQVVSFFSMQFLLLLVLCLFIILSRVINPRSY